MATKRRATARRTAQRRPTTRRTAARRPVQRRSGHRFNPTPLMIAAMSGLAIAFANDSIAIGIAVMVGVFGLLVADWVRLAHSLGALLIKAYERISIELIRVIGRWMLSREQTMRYDIRESGQSGREQQRLQGKQFRVLSDMERKRVGSQRQQKALVPPVEIEGMFGQDHDDEVYADWTEL